MNTAHIFVQFLLFGAIAVAESANVSRNVSENEMKSSEPLAEYVFELFRRSIEVGAGKSPKELENSGILLVHGSEFRQVQGNLMLLCV